ncbi:MAG: hypothetical protein HC866_09945 [Leptolyngbyaceae cyanobacterium RU_5_1]|nr:hypothetical protein [Leptolyngbyaceae cyanobacterium RU_5_1]
MTRDDLTEAAECSGKKLLGFLRQPNLQDSRSHCTIAHLKRYISILFGWPEKLKHPPCPCPVSFQRTIYRHETHPVTNR